MAILRIHHRRHLGVFPLEVLRARTVWDGMSRRSWRNCFNFLAYEPHRQRTVA